MTAVLTFAWLGGLLWVGKLLRLALPPLRRFFIPSSIIAGMVGLALGPEIWGQLDAGRPSGWTGWEVRAAMAQLPGFLISVVFAALFLGKTIPRPREIWRRAGPQVAFGQSLAWGMYAVGLGLTMWVLVPWYQVPPAFGTLLEIGFEGGHGTAAGLRGTFEAADWPEGTDLALGVATVGVVLGVILGMALINWGVRYGQTAILRSPVSTTEESESAVAEEAEFNGLVPVEEPPDDRPPFPIRSIEPASLHLAYIGIAVGIGYALQQALIQSEAALLGPRGIEPLMSHLPLFPLAMIGGILLQWFHSRFLPRLRLQRAVFAQLQGVALDYLIVAALASLSLRALAAHWQPLTLLIAAGLVWLLGMFLIVGRRILPDFWFERAIGDFGQSMGVTATGLLLLRIVDPDYRSPAYEAFGYKQLLFEPFVGGGLVTALSVPLVVRFGPWPLFSVSLGLTVFWIVFGRLFFPPTRTEPRPTRGPETPVN